MLVFFVLMIIGAMAALPAGVTIRLTGIVIPGGAKLESETSRFRVRRGACPGMTA